MGETGNLLDGCDRKNGLHLMSNFSFCRLGPAVAYMSWKNIGYQVTTNVPIFIVIRSGDKICSIFFDRSYTVFNRSNFQYGGKRGLGATSKASSYRTKPI